MVHHDFDANATGIASHYDMFRLSPTGFGRRRALPVLARLASGGY
jgi:hypothetical protein